MATPDDTTQTPAAPPVGAITPEQWQAAAAQFMPPPVQRDTTPVKRSWVSLLGEALGGGETPGQLTPQESEQAGNRALISLGANMLMHSGYSYPGRTLGEIVGGGLGAAQGSLAGTEAVSAARLGAQQEYAHQQFQDRMEALKNALPYLRMQQGANLPNLLAGGGAAAPAPSGVPGTTPGTKIGEVGVPAEYLPYYQEASARTGIPVDVLIAQHRQESNFNPNAVGSAGELGIGQVAPATAAHPGYGLPSISAADLKDPRKNINWSADYLRRMLPAGADPTDPAAITQALKAYNGGGDKNYVANVTRYIPGAATAAAASVPGAAQPAAPTQYAGPGVPPPGAPTGAAAGLPVGAPVPGGEGLVVKPGGMVGNPDLPSAAPAPGPTTAAEPTWEQFQAQHPLVITPAQQANLAHMQQVQRQWAVELQNTPVTGEDRQKVVAAAATADKNLADAQAAIEKDHTDNLRALFTSGAGLASSERLKAQELAQADRLEQQRLAQQAAEAQRQREAATALETQRGEQQRLTNTQTADLARQEDRMKAIDTAAGGARDSLNDLDAMRALSESVGTVSPWTQIPLFGVKIQDLLTRLKVGSPETLAQMGNQQAYESAVNKIITGLRTGVSMGNLSDRDLDFIRSQAPSMMLDPKVRGNIIGFLEQAYQRKVDYAQTVSKYYRPGITTVAEAEQKANAELGPILKTMPAYGNLTGDDQRKARDMWIYNNITPGTFYKDLNGRLRPYNPPAGWKPEGIE